MATISNTPRPGYVWDSADNVWYPIGVGAHQHTNAADTPAVMPYSTYAAAGKNKIINGDFGINQRAFTTSTTSGVYGFDRWVMVGTGGTVTYSTQAFTPGTAPVVGYEAKNYAQVITASQSAAGDRGILIQRIENARNFANQPVVISFWAKAASGTPKIGVEIAQDFGTGGSPSSFVTNGFGSVTISTSWVRYSVTATLASVSGKTFGTNNNDFLSLGLWVSAGADFATRGQSIGVQNNTFDIWGVQVEQGSVATAFQTATGNPASELAACQRYFYQIATGTAQCIGSAWAQSATQMGSTIYLKSTMRANPTLIATSGTNYYLFYRNGGNDYVNSLTLGTTGINVCELYNNSEVASTAGHAGMLFTDNASASIALSAEL